MMLDDDALLELTRTLSAGRLPEFEDLQAQAGEEPNFTLVLQLKTIGAVARAHASSLPEEAAMPRRWRNLELRQELGKGAFGHVYRAWDGNLEREVALKLTKAPDAQEMTEARMLARVHHPNVVQVHGVEREEGAIGLWMELIRGETLETLIRQRGPMSAHEAALTGIDLCKAVAAVHRAGLVHRDIKAQNVMREAGGRIVLMDFGIGEAVTADTPSGTMDDVEAGTPAYMAPELLRGGRASAASDIYAIGVLLYRLASGAYPVSCRTLGELRDAHDRGRTVLLRDRRPDLPDAFIAIVERALAPRPEDRFPTAGALERALLQSIASVDAPAARRPRRRLWWAASAAGIALIVLVFWFLRPSPLRARAIAVLPFTNVGADSTLEYFSDGVTEELINALGRIRGLQVVARNTAFRFKGRTDRIQDIGSLLNVGTVVCGTVRRSGQRLRVTAEMFKVADGYRLWAETYDRQLQDVFAIQDDIARSVSSSLQLKLAGIGLPAAPTRGSSFTAYDDYLLGRFHYNKRSIESMRRGLGYFEKAVAEDPNFALAYTGIADSYSSLVDYGGLTPAEGMPKAKEAALKALGIGPELPEAHASLGLVCSLYDWDWARCAQNLRHAIELNASLPTAHHWYGTLLVRTGRLKEAMAEADSALQQDPLSVPIKTFISFLFLFSREYEKAIEQARKVLELDPDNLNAHHALAQAYARLGRKAEAMEYCRKAAALAGDSPLRMRYSAVALAAMGMLAEARQLVDAMEQRLRREKFQVYYLAVPYAALGEKDRALELLDRAFDERDTSLPYVIVDPTFDSIRGDPRYARLVEKLGLTAPAPGQPAAR